MNQNHAIPMSMKAKPIITRALPLFAARLWCRVLLLLLIVTSWVGIANATTLVNGGNQAAALLANTTNSYTLTASTGDSIVLRLGTVGFDGYVSLFGPNGAFLKSAASGTDAELDYSATNGGSFTVQVSSYFAAGAGTYVLYLAQFPEPFIVPNGFQGGALTNGGNFSGTNHLGGLSLWSFTANAGDNIVLRLGTVGYDGNLSLYGPNGALLKNTASGTDAALSYTATNSGTFTVLVDSYFSGGVGTYVLSLAQFPEPFIVPSGAQGGALTNGGNYAGTNNLGGLSLWSVSANAGDNIVLRLGTVGFNGELSLYGPNGALLKSAVSGTDAELDYTATNGGSFTVLVESDLSGGIGTYVLSLAQFTEPFIVPSGAQGGALTNGGNYAGTNRLGGLSLWSVTANAGDNIVLRLGTVGFYGNLSLYGPNGALLKNTASGTDAELDYTATNSGTFTALVDSYSSGGTGTYVLYLAQFPEPFIVPSGTQGGPLTGSANYTGTISQGELNLWAFTACLHDVFSLELKTTNFYGDLQLYGENGALLKTAASGTDAVLAYTATNCGTFTLLVSSYSSGGAGTYGLTANGLAYELKLCPPFIAGINLTLNGVGGTNGTGFHLYSTTNITMPWALWTPVLTNNFDQYGAFNYTNGYLSAPPQKFFRFVLP